MSHLLLDRAGLASFAKRRPFRLVDHDPLVLGVPAGLRWRAGTLKPREIRA